MTKTKTNPITGHHLTLMTPTPTKDNAFGWIRLVNNGEDAGYIYLKSPPEKPRLSFGEKYIVTSIPMGELATMLDILRNEKNMQIRFHDSEVDGNDPSVFIEPRDGAGLSQNVAALPQELQAASARLA